ncbi:hypothetical protein [Myxococcus sp. Y35]|uniref:hypothetical protein n=1 Tax=Pseudomyxococcus flavus TaxID=3115648 RepID=UPI003CF31CD8
MKHSPLLRVSRLFVAALALSLAPACSDDDSDPQPNPPDSGTPDSGTPDSGTPETPVYSVITQVRTAQGSQSYIVLTDTLERTEPLSLDNAIEVSGRALGHGIPGAGALYISSDEGATVTRYDLVDGNRLEQGETVSFEGVGVNSIGEYQHNFHYVSPTKAYYFDGRTSQVIVWNPTDMTLTRTVPIPNLAVSGALTSFTTHPVTSGNLVMVAAAWRPATGIGITPRAGMVVVDTETDAVTFATDDRCGYVRDGVLGPDGAVYVATETYGSAVYRVSTSSAPAPCLLKFDPETKAFDAAFYRELSSFTGGAATGSLLPGPNGAAYLRVLDETLYTVTSETVPRALASAQVWTWWKLDLSAFTATHVEALQAGAGSSFVHPVEDDRMVYVDFINNSSATAYRELTDESGTELFTHQGMSFSFLQLR